MTQFYLGQREQIAYVEEDSWATLGTKSMSGEGEIVGKNMTITPDDSQGWQETISAGSDTREVEDLEVGPLQHRFTLSFTPISWKFLQFCAHGSVANSGSSPNFTHTFTLSNDVKSFTLEWAKRGDTNEVITYTGCIIKSLRISFSKGTGDRDGFINVEATCLAKSKVKGTSITTLSAPTLDAFKFHHVKMTYNSSEFVEVNSGELSIDNGIVEDDSRYANSSLNRTIDEPIPRKVAYGLNLNINQKDSTFTQDFIDAIAVPNNNLLEFIRTDSDDKATFTFTNLFLISPNNPTDLDGISTQDVVGQPLSVAPVIKDQIETYFS